MFKLRVIGKRFLFKIFSFQLSFCLKGQKDKFITLGTNCFPRTKLTKFGIKATKKQGELSFPFDLCALPIESVSHILENDYKDFFDDLYYDEELNIWKNLKYNILFWHDKNMDKNSFVQRYKTRIENFKYKTKNLKDIVFVSVLFDVECNEKLYSKVFSSLNKYSNSNFKYIVINIVSKKNDLVSKNIDNKLFYKEITEPCENYSSIWTNHGLDKEIPNMFDFYKEYVDYILEISYL